MVGIAKKEAVQAKQKLEVVVEQFLTGTSEKWTPTQLAIMNSRRDILLSPSSKMVHGSSVLEQRSVYCRTQQHVRHLP